MGSRIARIRRAIAAYYNWDNDVTQPYMAPVELGPDIDCTCPHQDALEPPQMHGTCCGYSRGKSLPSIEEWRATQLPPPAPGIDDFSRERGWMGTYSGGKFFPLSPRAAEVQISDIAHGLAMTCRYGGQCRRFYSVAEHCVHVSWMVDPKYALYGLLHDSAEAYIGDMIRPLKHQPEMQAFRFAEECIELAVAEHFGLTWTPAISHNVKEIDNRILADEVLQLQTCPSDYQDVLGQQPLGVTLQCWNPAQAEVHFLDRFYQLTLAARTQTVQP